MMTDMQETEHPVFGKLLWTQWLCHGTVRLPHWNQFNVLGRGSKQGDDFMLTLSLTQNGDLTAAQENAFRIAIQNQAEIVPTIIARVLDYYQTVIKRDYPTEFEDEWSAIHVPEINTTGELSNLICL